MPGNLATYCAESNEIDRNTETAVRRHLIDWIGLVAGGRVHATSTSSIIAAVEQLASSPVPAGIPTGRSLAPDRAALLAGTFAHSLDFDDTHLASSLHPGAPVIAATLPIARREAVDAASVHAAIVLGYDVTCAVGRAVDPDAHYARGFHVTATCGSFGAAAAVGALLDFDAATFAGAFGVVGSQAAGSLQFLENGAWNKRLHPGLAARRGVLAATLAANDFEGAAAPLTGTHGFLQGYSDDPHPDRLATIEPGRAIRETGLKPYPCCRYMHPAIDGVRELADRVAVDAIESITVDLPTPGVRLTGAPIERKRRPANFVHCQFSMPFAAALTLMTGDAGLDAYLTGSDRVDDPEMQALMDRVSVVSTDRTNDPFPERWSAHVRVDAGDRHERYVDQPRGEPSRPMTSDARETKFRELVADTPLADDVIETVRDLGDGADMPALFAAIESA